MIKTMTDDDINALAGEICRGGVFTSNHIRKEDIGMLPVIFIPLVFACPKLIEELRKEDMGMIYEYISEAGPSSVNGYPSFFSLHIVSQEDANRVWEKYAQIKKAVEGVIKSDENPEQ